MSFAIFIGDIKAEIPKINPKLKILEPIIFPIEILELPIKAADKETKNSGKEVPKAKIVRPIMLSEILYFFATF